MIEALHSSARAHLERTPPPPPPGADTVTALRYRVQAESAAHAGAFVEVANVDDLTVRSEPDVPVRRYVFTPDAFTPDAADVLVYCHGGGFVAGSLDTVDAVCRRLAARSGWTVVSVDYRLAPEAPFPAAANDVESVVRWVLEETRGRVVVAGESAGGNLAAVVARRLRANLAGQLLVYPLTACREDSWSHRRFASGLNLTTERLARYWQWYLPGGIDGANPDVSPLFAEDLADLPPACILVAGCDPLRADGEEYAVRLRGAGVPVRCVAFDGMIHGFFRLAGAFDTALEADDVAAEWLRDLR